MSELVNLLPSDYGPGARDECAFRAARPQLDGLTGDACAEMVLERFMIGAV